MAGVKEQILKDEYGWVLDNNLESLVNKLEELKDKKQLLLEYKQKLLDYKYDNQSILNQYYSLFEE